MKVDFIDKTDPDGIARILDALAGRLSETICVVGINAYNQPGVEAGKKAAASVLDLQGKVLSALSATGQTAEQIATGLDAGEAVETIYLLLEHLAANGRARMAGPSDPGTTVFFKQ